MKDNDLSAAPTQRFWVTGDVVFARETETETKKTGWFNSLRSERVLVTPDLATMSRLWQWSATSGVRMELIFFGDLTADAPGLWQMLDQVANPFSDYLVFEDINAVVKQIPFRPDLMGIIDLPSRSAMYGGKGLTTASLH